MFDIFFKALPPGEGLGGAAKKIPLISEGDSKYLSS
jgi:hypothetical protein